jgi:DNA-binding protein HU-beta
MARSMTKAQLVDHLAKRVGLTKKDTAKVLNELAAVAYKQAKSGFTIPGIGKLVVQRRKARNARNPATGEVIRGPARRVVKFRVSRTAQDAIVPPRKK